MHSETRYSNFGKIQQNSDQYGIASGTLHEPYWPGLVDRAMTAISLKKTKKVIYGKEPLKPC
jgi:hypothetical protein